MVEVVAWIESRLISDGGESWIRRHWDREKDRPTNLVRQGEGGGWMDGWIDACLACTWSTHYTVSELQMLWPSKSMFKQPSERSTWIMYFRQVFLCRFGTCPSWRMSGRPIDEFPASIDSIQTSCSSSSFSVKFVFHSWGSNWGQSRGRKKPEWQRERERKKERGESFSS